MSCKQNNEFRFLYDNELSNLWFSYLKPKILNDYVMDPYPGLRICKIDMNMI